MAEVLLIIWLFWALTMWSIAVAMSDDCYGIGLGSWFKIIYSIFMVMLLSWFLMKALENEQENKLDCATKQWEYRAVYRSSDECIKDGKIIKVYN